MVMPVTVLYRPSETAKGIMTSSLCLYVSWQSMYSYPPTMHESQCDQHVKTATPPSFEDPGSAHDGIVSLKSTIAMLHKSHHQSLVSSSMEDRKRYESVTTTLGLQQIEDALMHKRSVQENVLDLPKSQNEALLWRCYHRSVCNSETEIMHLRLLQPHIVYILTDYMMHM